MVSALLIYLLVPRQGLRF